MSNPWKLVDDDLPTREEAERMIEKRLGEKGALAPSAVFQPYEFRVVESRHPGSWSVEARKALIFGEA